MLPPPGRNRRTLLWIVRIVTRVAIPAAHLDKLLDASYIRESVTGPILTELGALALEPKLGK